MPIMITDTEKRTEKNELTKLSCSHCGEKVRGVGLLRGSHVEGLVFRCRKCGAYLRVTTE